MGIDHDAQQVLLARMRQEMDVLEAMLPPLRGSYEFLPAPYLIHPNSRVPFDFVVFNRESQSWFDNDGVEGLTDMVARERLVRPGDVVLDIGCNSGYLATIFATLAGSTGRVLAFDPFPWNTLGTRFTAAVNGLGNVEPVTAGIGDRDGTIQVSTLDSRTHGGAADAPILAEIHALERYAARNPTVMKIDVEGAEHEISRVDFSRFPAVRLVMLELHPVFLEPRGIDPLETIENYRRQGFRVVNFHQPDREWEPDGAPLFPSMHFLLWRT